MTRIIEQNKDKLLELQIIGFEDRHKEVFDAVVCLRLG
jgi:hypothetical protein